MSLHLSSTCGLSTSLRVECRTYGNGPKSSGGRRTSQGHAMPIRISLSQRMLVLPSHRNYRLIPHSSSQPLEDESTTKPEVIEEPSIPIIPSFRHNLPSGKRLEVIVRRGVGSEQRPQLVFLHGSYHGAWCWEKWMPYLSERGHDCYAVSFLGQGESDIPGGVGGTLQSHAENIAHLVRIIFSRPPVLIGHSFGGLVIQSLLARPPDGSADPSTPSRPPLAAAVLLCSVPPSGKRGVFLKRGIQTKPIDSMKISFGLAAKLFKQWTWLCRETFFSPDMPEADVERYQKLMAISSKVPLFNLRALNKGLPVERASPDHPPIVVMGAANDVVVDEDALQETAQFYKTVPLVVPRVAHDLMLDVNWEMGAAAVAELVASLPKQS